MYGSSSSVPGDGVYEMGVELGRCLAQAGFGVVNGGYSGLMEAVSAGAVGAGGRAIGVTAPSLFPGRPGGNSYLTEEAPAGASSTASRSCRRWPALPSSCLGVSEP